LDGYSSQKRKGVLQGALPFLTAVSIQRKINDQYTTPAQSTYPIGTLMAQPVTMPKMGFDMLEGTIVRWLKHEGAFVAIGEVIAEIETDKATVELESPIAGILLTIVAQQGDLVPIDGVLAHVGAYGETVPLSDASNPSRVAPRVSPVAQRIAIERNFDTEFFTGTGRGGRVTTSDVLAATAGETQFSSGLRTGYPPRTPDLDGNIILGPMGEAIARRTQATIRDVPHVHFSVSINMTAALDFRRAQNRAQPGSARISVNDIIIKATTLALLKYPVFNSTFEGDHLTVHSHVNIGIAIALPRGLIVPAILSCELQSLGDIAESSKGLAQRAVNGTLRQAEYSGTFSISNLGMYGIDSFTSIVVAPQVAVLSLSSVKPTPVVANNEIVIQQILTITLGIDHRAVSGAEAAQFLSEVKRVLEEPDLLSI
jgi:pyruvate dehydrogenase E2 component (dihydrolipoamide acetyltransferase)